MKIIIIDHEPFSERKNQHYYIDKFLSNGIDVEYWDVSKALAYTKDVIYTYRGHEPYVTCFTNYKLLLDTVRRLDSKKVVVILEISFREDTFSFFKLLKNKNIKIVRINYYHNPTRILADHLTSKDRLFKFFDFKWVIRKLKTILHERGGKLSKPDLLFVTGKRENIKGVRSVSLDFFDVEDYKKMLSSNSNPIVEPPYIVFLDIMFANHPDFQRLGIKTVDQKMYFDKIKAFFDLIEKKYKKPVVIASHPKASYSYEFGNRKIIKGETGKLIKDADLVLTHGSLSISFALLFSKPLIYIYFDEMLKSPSLFVYYRRMVNASSQLGACLINIDSKIEDISTEVDDKKYKAFLQKVYLKDPSDSRDNFLIIKENLYSLIQK